MTRTFGTYAMLAARLAMRPPEYARDIEAATLEKTGEGIWFDLDHPALAKWRLPLAGDLVDAMTAKIGVKRAIRLWARLTGAVCNCAERQERLNQIDAMLRAKFLP